MRKHSDKKNIWNGMVSYCNDQEQLFSQLKHLSLKLSQSLQQSGQLLTKLSSIYETSRKSDLQLSRRLGVNESFFNWEIAGHFSDGLLELGKVISRHQKLISDRLAPFFHLRKHEFKSLKATISAKQSFQDNLKSEIESIGKTKRKLYETKDFDKWKVDLSKIRGDLNLRLKSFENIKEEILPEVDLLGN